MKINDELIDVMFEKWFAHNPVNKFEAHEAFKAAFDFLLPILEKQSEALEFYQQWCRDDLHCELICAEPTDKVARSTLAFVEQEIKKMGGGG